VPKIQRVGQLTDVNQAAAREDSISDALAREGNDATVTPLDIGRKRGDGPART